jgi:hypothetical protein
MATVRAAAILSALMPLKLPSLNWAALDMFAISGLFALDVGSLLYFIAVGRIGVAVSSAVREQTPDLRLHGHPFTGQGVRIYGLPGRHAICQRYISPERRREGFYKGGTLVIPFLSTLSYSLSNMIRKAALNL